MTKKLVSSSHAKVKTFFATILKFPIFLKKQFCKIKQEFGDLYYHLNHMANSNMKLGIYHLYKHHYNDAIFRFQMVDRFLDPHNKEANYWLGWAYLLKGDHKKSITHLIKAEKEDKIGLLDFVKSIEKVKNVPEEIHIIHRDIKAPLFIDKFVSDSVNLPKQLVIELNNHISKLPKEYKLLELGSNVGMLSYELDRRMQEKMHLTSIEPSEEMIKLQAALFPKGSLYDEIIDSSISKFFKSNKKKYDIICSMDGFSFESDLSKVFSDVAAHLKPSGYFAFVVKSSGDAKLGQDLEFSYDSDDLSGKLTKAGLQILTFKEISLAIKNNYSIFVCIKSK